MEFSKRKIIIKSWNILKNHLGLWVFIMLLVFALNLLLSSIQNALLDEINHQTILFIIAAYLFQMGLNLGMLQIALKINSSKEVGLKDLIGSFHMLIPYVLATIISLIIILFVAMPGIVLLLFSVSSDWNTISSFGQSPSGSIFIPVIIILVPVVYASIRLQYYDYFLIDIECGVIDAIKNSIEITKGYTGELFLLGAILAILVLISIIPLGAGLVISIPLGIMVHTYTYQKLNKIVPKD